jgi:hypothetical protein
MTFAVGQRVTCVNPIASLAADVEYRIVAVDGFFIRVAADQPFAGDNQIYFAHRFAPIPDAPPAVQPAACVPDDQPQETYAARRQRIAAERNKGHGTCGLCGGVILRCPCSTADYAAPYRRHTGADKQQQQAEGVARAVRNLSQVEHRVGAAKFQPQED